jgi:hypothetical protein
MRFIKFQEKKKRGCLYCQNVVVKKSGYGGGDSHTACPFDECPYKVLDKYETYEAFMKSEDSKILVNEFFSSVASCYECQSRMTPNRSFSDGDSRVGI